MGALLDLTTEISVEQAVESFRQDVIAGLSAQRKTLPCKYFYDEAGSRLFEDICDLEEYYLTRTELSLLNQVIDDIAHRIGPDVTIIEPGSGAGTKIRLLLESLDSPQSYIPVEISKEALLQSVEALSAAFPDIEMQPIAGDFDQVFSRPDYFKASAAKKRVVFFPGSTIGNFDPVAALGFLKKIARTVGKGGGLLIGVDLIKDRHVLLDAYNDANGVTEAFNKNLLQRINNELQGEFELDAFAHRSIYSEDHNRIEMHLVSQYEQSVKVDGHRFAFRANESIHTENSHKYSVDSFRELAAGAGFGLVDCWRDDKNWFAVFYFEQQAL